MVFNKHGEQLYNGLKEVIRTYLNESYRKIMESNDEIFLNVLNDVWSNYKVSILMIRDILMYMVTIVNLWHLWNLTVLNEIKQKCNNLSVFFCFQLNSIAPFKRNFSGVLKFVDV
jgi:hypothetical protein